MSKLGVFYGSETGNTEEIAGEIAEYFDIEAQDIRNVPVSKWPEYSHLILGIPTWNDGELQGDWYDIFDDLEEEDFSNTQVALFGLGDQFGYPYTFLDAAGLLYEKLQEQGASFAGLISPEGYDFSESKALIDGKLVCLGLDYENQEELNEERIENWVEQIKKEGFVF